MSGAVPPAGSQIARATDPGTCRHCGEHVTDQFGRVFGDANGDVHRCFDCDTRRRVLSGSAAGKTVPHPDPQDQPERYRGESP